MATVAEMRDMDDIDGSSEAGLKEGTSINGDMSCDDSKEDCDETSEVSAGNNCASRDGIEPDQNSTDKINCDEDSALVDNIDSSEEIEEDYEEGEKMDVDEVTFEEDNSEQIHEIDNSDLDEESDDDSKADNLQNGINSSDEIAGEQINEANKNRSITIRDSLEDVVVLDDKDPIEVLDKDGVEIVDDDSVDDNKESAENGSTVESGEDDDDDVQISETIENHNRIDDEDDDVISLEDDSPTKSKSSSNDSTAPRRSSRNLNREKKRYSEDEYVLNLNMKKKMKEDSSEESDIEEVLPVDPLADSSSMMTEHEKPKKSRASSSTIVVKDTKCLAEIASKSSSNSNSKKEPTLVIIDTNSILSGRGPVPISQKSSMSTSISNSYSMIPMALPAQGIYPPNMRATITPIPMTPVSTSKSAQSSQSLQPVLPTLSDDMFVVEAPSFIVPYVYEKPPIKDLQQLIKDLETQIIEEKIQKDKDDEESSKKSNKKKDEDEEMDTDDVDDEKEKKSDDKEKKGDEKENIVDNDEEEKDVEKLVNANYLSASGAVISDLKKPGSYFQSPLGKFFMGIGYGLVQEAVQSDLLKQQKRRREREGNQNPETTKTISLLLKNLECTKEHNEPYRMVTKKCEYCSFKTESALVMAYHLETPHMKNYIYRCNFCPYEVRSPHDILYHMEVQHGVKGRLERAPAFHQCPNCPFEDNQKGKLSRHMVSCARKYKPEHNLEPPIDYEPPAKIPRAPRMKQQGLSSAAAVYQAMAKNNSQYQMMTKMATNLSPMQRVKGRANMTTSIKQANIRPSPGTNLLYKQTNMSGGSVLVPTNYQLGGNQLYQVVGGQEMGGRLYSGATAFVPGISAAPNSVSIQQQQQNSMNKMKQSQQPSISITPLPRGSTTTSGISMSKPGDSNSKNSFVICEICDGYIKDLEQLRNHMQWIHKVKIHPKMIYNRPPLNCQKCQFRFFTDQGLERHLLGSHGLVTSSMQEAANRSKDAGRCPVCGRVYQWKLLNHVARDHNMTLKPAHLSYKCTVCTATFGMYKQFESHVYSAHSVVAKRVMDKKTSVPTSSSNKNESVLKPLKINDEITIIPQPAKSTNGISGGKEGSPSTSGLRNSGGSFSNGNPSSSKKEGSESPSLSRAERLSRRKSNLQSDN